MNKNEEGNLWIGTSNIVLPGNKTLFPPAYKNESRLNYYSTLFNSVELNSPFYKVPLAKTFVKWSNDVNGSFRFSVKLWKEITHAKELQFKSNDINMFLERISVLGYKKGCLLIQFPGKISLDYFSRVEEIFQIIDQSSFSKEWKVVTEFRHPSWYTGEAFELLDEFNASMAVHDFSKVKNDEINKNAPVAFVRFHGPAGDYRGSYSNEFLEKKAECIKKWIKTGKDVYAYFNNTAGDGYQNARTLQFLTESK